MTTSRLSRPRARRLAAAALIVALFFAAGTIGGRLVTASAQGPAADPNVIVNPVMYQGLRYRSVGPHRGGRVTAISGVRQQPCTFYQGAHGRRRLEDDRLRRAVGRRSSDGQIETGSIGAIAVAESNPDIVWVGTGQRSHPQQRHHRPRGLQVGRRRPDVDAGRPAGRRADRVGGRSIPRTPTSCGWPWAARRSARPTTRGVYKTTDGGKTWTRTLFVNRETGARVVAINPSNPDEVYAGDVPRLPQGLGHHQRRAGQRGRHLQVHRRRHEMGEALGRAAAAAHRQDRHRRGAEQAEHRLRHGRGARARGRPLSIGRQRRDVGDREQQPAPARAAVLLPLRRRQPEERERGLGERTRPLEIHRRRQDVRGDAHAARRQPRHLVQPRQSRLSRSSATTAAPTSRATAARRGRRS